MSSRTTIVVRTQFEGIHQWVEAPVAVAFLRVPHRHMFHVELEMDVTHDDRELEFILVKRGLDNFLFHRDFPVTSSCEQLARAIIDWATIQYGKRRKSCSVFEDGENGARVRE